jgi:hypothetical protein
MREYIVRNSAAHSTAITILQLTAHSTSGIQIIRAWVTQSTSTTSSQTAIQLVRKSATATGLSSITPVKLSTLDPAAVTTAGHTATGEGTDTDVLIREGFNILNGWVYLPVPEERIDVPPSGIIGLKFPSAPASATYEYGIVFVEVS